MKKNIITCLAIAAVLFSVGSCKKDSAPGTKAVFSFSVDGFLVNFTNFSTNAKKYAWDFGDGSDAAAIANPSHMYSQKGQYIVTLTVKNETETSVFKDTVNVVKAGIIINGDFNDWGNIPWNPLNPSPAKGTILGIKTFASSEYLNIYVEGTPALNFELLDMYVDADNDAGSGYGLWMYPAGSGADVLIEGALDQADPGKSVGSVLKYIGPDWNWSPPVATWSDVIKFSQMKDLGGKKGVEFSIKLSVLGNLKGYVNFGLFDNHPTNYSELGSAPLSGEGAQFTRVKL